MTVIAHVRLYQLSWLFGSTAAAISLLVLVPCMSMAQDPVRSVTPKRVDPLPADPPVYVSTGSSSVLQYASVIDTVDIVKPDVCNVRLIRGAVIIQGKNLGKTRVTLLGENQFVKTFDVIVLPDRNDVLTRLIKKYPESNLRLVPAPEIGKVVVEGTLPSVWAIEDVLEQMTGSDLCRNQILSRMSYPYSPVCSPTVEGATCHPVRRFRR